MFVCLFVCFFSLAVLVFFCSSHDLVNFVRICYDFGCTEQLKVIFASQRPAGPFCEDYLRFQWKMTRIPGSDQLYLKDLGNELDEYGLCDEVCNNHLSCFVAVSFFFQFDDVHCD